MKLLAMNKKKLVLISCFSGLLLSLAWLDLLFAPLMLVAFVPMLWVEDYISKNNEDKRFSSYAGFAYSYLPFLIWNATTIFWVSFSTPAALQASAQMLISRVRNRLPSSNLLWSGVTCSRQ